MSWENDSSVDDAGELVRLARRFWRYIVRAVRRLVRAIRELFGAAVDEGPTEPTDAQDLQPTDGADLRAYHLLMQNLDEEQRRMFERTHEFIVHRSRDMEQAYRITGERTFGVKLLMKIDGVYRTIGALCVLTEGDIPIYDTMLQLKLMLEADGGEIKIFKTANFHWAEGLRSTAALRRIRALKLVEFYVMAGSIAMRPAYARYIIQNVESR